jgi:hypothetical protein
MMLNRRQDSGKDGKRRLSLELSNHFENFLQAKKNVRKTMKKKKEIRLKLKFYESDWIGTDDNILFRQHHNQCLKEAKSHSTKKCEKRER